MLVNFLISINAIILLEDIEAQELESNSYSSTSNPFPTPYKVAGNIKKSATTPMTDIKLRKGQDNSRLISEHLKLLNLIELVKSRFNGIRKKPIKQNFTLRKSGFRSDFQKAQNTTNVHSTENNLIWDPKATTIQNHSAKYLLSREKNVGKSKPMLKDKKSRSNGDRKDYSKTKTLNQYFTKNDQNQSREAIHSYKEKHRKKMKNSDIPVDELERGQFACMHAVTNSQENVDVVSVETGIKVTNSAANLTQQNIHQKGKSRPQTAQRSQTK